MDTMLDPLGLNVNLQEVDTSRPVLKDGEYYCTIKEVSIVPKKDDPNKRNLLIVVTLAQEGNTPDGKTIQPGYQLRRYLPLQQSDNENAGDFKVDLTRFLCAAFGIDPKDKSAIPQVYPPLETFAGRPVNVVVKCKDDDTGKSNDVSYFKSAS